LQTINYDSSNNFIFLLKTQTILPLKYPFRDSLIMKYFMKHNHTV